MLKEYYESYWSKRIDEKPDSPISEKLPKFFKKYTSYGAILRYIEPCNKLLDVGCGDGNVSQLYKSKSKEVFGIDISKTALEQAKQRGIQTFLQDLNLLPLCFEDEYFDYIVLTDVIEHIVNPIELLKESKRMLKNGGIAIITTPNFARLSNRLRMAFLGDPIDILHWSKYGDEVEHLHWFTLPKLNFILKETVGFKKIKYIPTGLINLGFIFGLTRLYNLGSFLTVIAEK